MKAGTIVLTLALCFVGASVCFAENAFMGAWKLNEAKSKFGPRAPRNTMVVYQAEGENIKMSVNGTASFTGTGTFTDTNTMGRLNGVRVVDGVTFTTIAQAVADLPATGGIVRLPWGYRETFTSAIDLGSLGLVRRVASTMDRIFSGP